VSTQEFIDGVRKFFDRPIVRNVISRSAMFVLGAVLLYWAYKCFGAQWMIDSDPGATGTSGGRRASSYLPMLIGIVLAIPGAMFAIGALIPLHWAEQIFRPTAPITHDNDVSESIRHWGNWL
jgi:hypothetical protein